jgi:hypothetical protein
VSSALLATGAVLLEDLPLAISRDEALRFQGYRTGTDVPTSEVAALFEEARALALPLIRPRVAYRAVPARLEGRDALAAGGETFRIPEIGRFWGQVTHAGIGLCTIGDALETRVRRLFDARELPLAVMLDSIGSAATEHLAESANDRLCRLAIPLGLRVTNRISPGYAGWDVADQRGVFRLGGGESAGIRLNEACVMTPGKSISFMVGIGPHARVDHYFTQCRRCWMRDCAYRRAPVVAGTGHPGRPAGVAGAP